MHSKHRYKMRGSEDGLGGSRGGRRGVRGDGPHGQRGGEGRRRRLFDGTELRLLILDLLKSQPRHGYDLIRALEEASGGAYVPSPGMVYPTLSMLAEMELVTETGAGSPRKLLALTDAGVADVTANANAIAALHARLQSLAASREKTDAAPVRRAMHNLRSVLMTRLGEEGVTRETMLEAVALIDNAAQAIERL